MLTNGKCYTYSAPMGAWISSFQCSARNEPGNVHH